MEPESLAVSFARQRAASLRADRPAGRVRDHVPMVVDSVAGGDSSGSILQRTRLSEMLAPARLARITDCIDGRCDSDSCRFARTPCTSCSRGLHVAECGQFGTARAAVGMFTCHHCRAHEMAPTRLVTASLLRAAIEVMVTELCLGAESTAGATADYNQLEADFVAEMGLSGDELLLPRHVLPTFLAFLLWVMKDIGRSRSMAGLWRTMGTLFSTWNLPDFTRYPQPRRLYKKMKTLVDTPPVPKTAATKRMFMNVLRPGGVIDLGEQSELIAHRERLCFALEGMGGGRLSETTDSGQGHGVTAVSVALITDHQDAGRQYVDILIETSKTGHARYTGAVGVSRSGVDLASYLQSYWNASGIDTLTTTAGGLTIRRGDRWTVRLNLLGFDSRRLDEFLGVLRSSSCLSAARHAKSTAGYMRDRLAAVGKGSETKKFVNIAAGRKACQAMRRLMVRVDRRRLRVGGH